MRRVLVALALSAPVGSCLSATEPVEILTWEGTLSALTGAEEELTGSVAMVIGEAQTQMGIRVRQASPGVSFGWAFREGTCEGSGQRLGPASIYPAIEVDEEGVGAAETVLHRRVATAGPYAAVVYENADGTGTVLACGDLERI